MTEKDMITATMSVDVVLAGRDVSEETLKRNLQGIIENAAQEGTLNKDTDTDVIKYTSKIDIKTKRGVTSLRPSIAATFFTLLGGGLLFIFAFVFLFIFPISVFGTFIFSVLAIGGVIVGLFSWLARAADCPHCAGHVLLLWPTSFMYSFKCDHCKTLLKVHKGKLVNLMEKGVLKTLLLLVMLAGFCGEVQAQQMSPSQVPGDICRLKVIKKLKLNMEGVYWNLMGEKYFDALDGTGLMVGHLEYEEDGIYQPYSYDCRFNIKSRKIMQVRGAKSKMYGPTPYRRW